MKTVLLNDLLSDHNLHDLFYCQGPKLQEVGAETNIFGTTELNILER